MRRFVSALSISVWGVVAAALSIGAVTAQDAITIRIEWPPSVYHVDGVITVQGTVTHPDLFSFFLELATFTDDLDDANWIPISLPNRTPVISGALGEWDTTRLEDGLYYLRVSAILTSNAILTEAVGPIRVLNGNIVDQTGGAVVVVPPAQPPPVDAAPGQPVVSPTPEATPTPVPRPPVVNDLPLPVGGQFNNFDEDALDLIDAAGFTWIKWQVPFFVDDPSLFAVARDRIDWSHANGFNAMLSIKGLPEQLEPIGAEDYFPLFAEFVGEIAALQPDAIQIWNEMNLDREWPRGQIDPELYVDLLRQSYEAIKAVDPEIIVMTGAPAPTGAEGAFGLDRVWNDDRYYAGMAAAGAADFADCIAVHYNEGVLPPDATSGDPRADASPTRYFVPMIRRASAPFAGSGVPFCFSELGYVSGEGYGELPSGFAWGAGNTVEEQAEWLAEAIQIAAALTDVDIQLIIVFNVNFDRFVDGDPQGGYAIIRPDGSCPACETIAALRR
ncbi:MAG: hypothetical protein GYB67_00390 [Chloroflexi bacterium]|nr:hypothetical protein [Chloroflexota bacterium]